MNPNSKNQTWSRWTATVTPDALCAAPSFADVRENCARFYRKAFGSATQLRVVQMGRHWTIDCRTEGHPAHDPAYKAYMLGNLERFLKNGFGPGALITWRVQIEAGSRQDGRPADQLIIGPPPVALTAELFGAPSRS